ncbi:MAG: hypothetical protein JRN62_03225 [Nitrososphaerota archaeon]|nr:hypothetical protein [Nitrososphaerota archaeon]MDG6948609.1 hypothetical protein [Nitrososphaerota archaeon]
MAAKDAKSVRLPEFDDPQIEKRYKRLEKVANIGALGFFIGAAVSLYLFFIVDLPWYAIGVILGTSVISESLMRQGVKAEGLVQSYGRYEFENDDGVEIKLEE